MKPAHKRRRIENKYVTDSDEDHHFENDGFIVFDDNVYVTNPKRRKRQRKCRNKSHKLAPLTQDTKRMIAESQNKKYKADINIDQGISDLDSDYSSDSQQNIKINKLKRRILDIDEENDESDDEINDTKNNNLNDFIVEDNEYQIYDKYQLQPQKLENSKLYNLFGKKIYSFLNIPYVSNIDNNNNTNNSSKINDIKHIQQKPKISSKKKYKFSVKLPHGRVSTTKQNNNTNNNYISFVNHQKRLHNYKSFIDRNIGYPLFSNISRQECYKLLSDKNGFGQIIFRPSSKGINYLSMTWKMFSSENEIYPNIFVNKLIIERNKPITNLQAIGKILIIEDEKYDDLDEIYSTIPELNKLVENMMQHKHFKYGDRNEISIMLKQEINCNCNNNNNKNNKGCYALSFSYRKPGYFLLSFIANKTSPVKNKYIGVKCKGYKFENKFFQTPSKVINFWKCKIQKK